MATDDPEPDGWHRTPAERYTALWQTRAEGAETPDVFAFLEGCTEATAEERLAVLLGDQRESWRAGQGRSVEEYLAHAPEVAARQEFVAELVHGELAARRLGGEPIDLGAFAARFPAMRQELTGLLSRADMDRLSETRVLEPSSGDTRSFQVRESHAEGGTIPADPVAPADSFRPGELPTLAGEDGAKGTIGVGFDLNPPPSGLDGESIDGLAGAVRFSIKEQLGTGGMGVVYRAFDHEMGIYVALKTMRRIDPSALIRFKEEFRKLVEVSHPNLVNLFELMRVGELYFFTMELVAGVDFVTYVRTADGVAAAPGTALGPSRISRLRRALRQLAEGIEALHAEGKLHRDVKPTNVLVSPDGRVVLLDFGLTVDLERSGGLSTPDGRVVGTVAYMSPEQATGKTLSLASDWYNVGVVLYEALTGRLPFDGTQHNIIKSKLNDAPVPPSVAAAGVPDDLNDTCLKLLNADVTVRLTGRELLARLSSEDLGAETSESPMVPETRRSEEVALVGRQAHRDVLSVAYETVKAGRPVLLLVSGRSGSGKSTLLNAFLKELNADRRAVVLSGRCHERDSLPYRALDSVVDQLSRYLKELPTERAAALLPRGVGPLTRMFPVLRDVPAIAACSEAEGTADPVELRRRATTALRDLFAAIARTAPLVVMIDDLHWGDVENAPLIEDLMRPPRAPVMLLVGSYRSEDGDANPLVRALRASPVFTGAPTADDTILPAEPERVELTVGELSLAESRELALQLLGSDDPVARVEAHAVARESRGNPFFISELVKHIRSGDGISLRGDPSRRLTLNDVLRGRIDRLPEAVRRLLEVIAVCGRPIGLMDACRAADLDPIQDGRTAASLLRAGRLVRGTGRPQYEEVEPYHDWVREAVLAPLFPESVAGHHLRLALTLESSGRVDPEALAGHYQAAGRLEWAARHYTRAAEAAMEKLAFAHAARLFRRALRLRPITAADSPKRLAEASRLRAGLADALASAGQAEQAADEYLLAAEGASEIDALEWKRRASVQLLLGGRVEEGFELLRTVLTAKGISVPLGRTRTRLALYARRLRLRVRGLDFVPRAASEISAEERSLIDLCWSAGAGLSIIDPLRGADFQTRGLLRALDAGDTYRIARALTLEAATISLRGVSVSARVEKLIARAVALERDLDDPHIEGLLGLARGIAALMVGRWREAYEWFNEAEPVLRGRCADVAWELNAAHNLSLWALTHLGDLDVLRRRWTGLLQEAYGRGDQYAVTTLNTYYMALIRLADDDPSPARAGLEEVMRRWSHGGYHIQHSAALRAATAISLYEGGCQEAWRQLDAEWRSYQRSLLPRVQLLRVQFTELRGRCALAAMLSARDPAPLLHEARRAVKSLTREGVTWADAHAVALRAGIAYRLGELPQAAVLLLEAADLYAAAEMRLCHLIARRRAGQILGIQDREGFYENANLALTALDVRDPAAFSRVFLPWAEDLEEPSTLNGEQRRKSPTPTPQLR